MPAGVRVRFPAWPTFVAVVLLYATGFATGLQVGDYNNRRLMALYRREAYHAQEIAAYVVKTCPYAPTKEWWRERLRTRTKLPIVSDCYTNTGDKDGSTVTLPKKESEDR